MKCLVILLIILIMFIPFSFAKEIVIPEFFDVPQEEIEIEPSKEVYYYGGSKLIASSSGEDLEYKYQDRLGSDINSKSLPFGQPIEVGDRFSFTGKELDSDLYYFNARYHDPELGRFTSVDPVSSEPAYSYVGNNPLNMVDPDGRLRIEGVSGQTTNIENPTTSRDNTLIEITLPFIHKEAFKDTVENYYDEIMIVSDELNLGEGIQASMVGVIYAESLRRTYGAGIIENTKFSLRQGAELVGLDDYYVGTNQFGVGPGHIHKDTVNDIWNFYSSHMNMFPANYLEEPDEVPLNIGETTQNLRYMGVLFTKMVYDWKDVEDISGRAEILSTFYNQGYGANGVSNRELNQGGLNLYGEDFGEHANRAGTWAIN
jgi:RHS repeat-associated protein